MVSFDGVNWDNTMKMSYLQRRIIIHSILYYEMDESVISDAEFDSMARQLVALMNESTQEQREATRYWYVMNNFDASTGHHIYSRLNSRDKMYLRHIAGLVLDICERRSK